MCEVVGEEGDGHMVAVGVVVGAYETLAQGDGGVVAFYLQLVYVVVDKSGGEDMEVEEAVEVDATVESEAVAQAGGVDGAEGAAVEEAVHTAVEE